MLHTFFDATRRLFALLRGTFLPRRNDFERLTPRRLAVMALFLPLLVLAQLVHWLGFLLDEVFFRGYRRVSIREPLFVLGVPRSGTTHLHRVLARDQQYTTFRTWECLFALSVTERKLWLGVAAADRAVGRPLGRLLGWVERRAFGALEGIHSMRLDDPEEDYFSLMPVLACFILVLPFPFAGHLWRMGHFDRDMTGPERTRLLDFYESCLKRHLYVHGTDKRLLSKNAAFAPLAGALAGRFPDARFIACLREPLETVPSQISSIAPGLAAFDADPGDGSLRERFVDLLAFYYENLDRALTPIPDGRRVWIAMPDLVADLEGTVLRAYRTLGLPAGEGFRTELAAAHRKARSYRTGHSYSLDGFRLTEEAIRTRFAHAYGRFDFGPRASADQKPAAGPRDTGRRSTEPALQTSEGLA